MFRPHAFNLLVAVLLCVSALNGQETRGSIVGRVADGSGAVMANAIVRSTNRRTNITTETISNTQGNYQMLYLSPGTYSIAVSAPGFKVFERTVELRTSERLTVDVQPELGEISERVTVQAETPLLESASANVGQVVASKNVIDLPTPHGTPRAIFTLLPGVTQGTANGQKFQDPTRPAVSSMLTINGAPHGTTEMQLDGVPNVQTVNSGVRQSMSSQPPSEAVEEMKLETAYDASVGYTSGATVNMLIKSGGNDFHGSVYAFIRDPSFYANSFFANRAGQPKGDFYYRRTGFTAGGPLLIPKVYNGRNKTFLFYALERYDDSLAANPFTGTVPTAAQRNGDFSALLALGPSYQIYDPFTTTPEGNGRFRRQPFANNIIPSSRISPIAKAISQYWPNPNAPGTADGTNNFVNQNNVTPTLYYNHIARVDHTVSEKYRVFGRFLHNYKNEGPYNDYLGNPASGAIFHHAPINFGFDQVITPTAAMVINLRYGLNHHPTAGTPKTLSFDLASLGFPSTLISQLDFRDSNARLFPRVDSGALAGLNPYTVRKNANDVHLLSGSVNRPVSNHGLQFGADFRAYRENRYDFGNATPSLTFGSTYTQGPLDNSPASRLGLGQTYASLLLGIPTGGFVDFNDSTAGQSKFYSIYAQDNWRVTRRLTLTLGLRYEQEFPLTERFNRSVRGFDPNATLSITPATGARGGLLFADAQNRNLWNGSRTKWMPRFGLAYMPNADTVFRAGYGIYYLAQGQPFGVVSNALGFNQRTDLIPTIDNGQSYVATLANPFPSGILRPAGNSQGPNTFLGRAISFFDPNLRPGYNQRWNLNIQRLLPARMVLEVGYAGSRVTALPIARDHNALPVQYLSTSPVRDQPTIDRLTAQLPNPFYPLLPGTTLSGVTVARQQLLRPYPQFSDMTALTNQGYSWYHSLQVRAERRFARGYSMTLAYTFSKLMEATTFLNAGDPLPLRTISPLDRRHHFALSSIYELPFGPGKALLHSSPGIVKALAGGWQINGIFQSWSGQPLGFSNPLFNGNPDDIKLSGSERTIDRWFNISGFDRAPERQLSLNRVTFPALFSGLRAPIFSSVDLSLIKNTQVGERMLVQFRAEAFNALNNVSFSAPNTVVTSSAFGTITGDNNNPRQIQLAIRLLF